MTPRERQLVDELFDRLAGLEQAPRDPNAERLIAAGMQRAPHAIYALVQTALVQDEALKRANARIEELQTQLSDVDAPQQSQGGFLDNMREAVFGRTREPAGSVPTVRPQGGGQTSFARETQPGYPAQGPAPGYAPQAPYLAGPAFGSGGSFLGTAASTAAGMVGGGLLLDGIRSMFGHHASLGALSQPASVGGLPWGSGSAASNPLAHQAGIDDIGRSSGAAGNPAAHVTDDGSDSSDGDDGYEDASNGDDGGDSSDDGDDFGGDDSYDT